ncbi:hypothetical protein [Polaribacter septentrionalilitoris]|uniref:hypothetical protein n=1 Tax=Polaribacter septentrionalilitoris TaxID=2494657 RepID=UPI0013586EFC|nr:hypothetical protein [Polaribacter septentrionalilitoris]
MKIIEKNKTKFKLILLTFVILEIVSCYYAYYTLGEVKQFFCILIFGLNIIPLVFYLFKLKRISLIIAFTIGLYLIPYQSFLFVKWYELKKEASMIVEYIYDNQKDTGEFPKDIVQYEFENRNLMANFSYNTKAKGFGLHYYIGTEGTTYFYNNNVGKWEYYPD